MCESKETYSITKPLSIKMWTENATSPRAYSFILKDEEVNEYLAIIMIDATPARRGETCEHLLLGCIVVY